MQAGRAGWGLRCREPHVRKQGDARVDTGPKRLNSTGFTLVELMIVIAVVAVLTAVAIPSYRNYIQRSHRIVGMQCLLEFVEVQVRYHIDNRTYGDLSDLGYAADTIGCDEDGKTSAGEGFYDFSVTENTVNTYTIQAVARNRQEGDSTCTTLTIDETGARAPTDCW